MLRENNKNKLSVVRYGSVEGCGYSRKLNKIKTKTMGTRFYVKVQIGRKSQAARWYKILYNRSEYKSDLNNSEPNKIKRRLESLTKHTHLRQKNSGIEETKLAPSTSHKWPRKEVLRGTPQCQERHTNAHDKKVAIQRPNK